MALSNEQAQNVLSTPKNKANLQKAIEHEDRLRFHADIITDTNIRVSDGIVVENTASAPYLFNYFLWVKSVITASDKFEQFKKLLNFPLRTNEVVDEIADEYSKVFDAQDSFFNVDFTDPSFSTDFNNYLEDIKDKDFWHNKAFKAMMSSISSILIVDIEMPDNAKDLTAEKELNLPEPYYYLLDIRKVIDINIDKDGEIEHIAFKDCEDRFVVLDDTFYRVYQKVDDKYILVSEVTHPLTYCPARFLWDDTISNSNPILKHAPISAILELLDWYLFFETAKKSLDLYASYPIYWTYNNKCGYKTHTGNECVGGRIEVYDEVNNQTSHIPCPACESKKIVGPGSLIKVPIPQGEMKVSIPPVGIVGIDKNSLDFNVSETERLRAIVVTSATGKNKLIGKQAINTDQVQGQFESQTNILNWIARNFEKAHKWTIDTVCKLRYANNYTGCSISYGTQFYLLTLQDAIADFQAAKNAGLPSYILISKMKVIEHLQNRSNPKEISRMEILRCLEPYTYLTLLECKNLGIDTIDRNGFVLKANFANFVVKFENEFGNIVEFGSKLKISEKINRINQKLLEYVRNSTSTTGQSTTGQSGTA